MKATVPETSKLTAGSFKDLTRIAGSNSADWASISNANRKDISSVMDSFINELKAAKKALGKPGLLEKRFEKAKVARHKLLNKQDKSQ